MKKCQNIKINPSKSKKRVIDKKLNFNKFSFPHQRSRDF